MLGHPSFGAYKAEHGSTATGNHLDHVVEQSQIAKSGFSPEQIHNAGNIVEVPASVNLKRAGSYASKPKFAGGLTVRNWLVGKSFEFQYQFGLDTLARLTSGD